MGWWISHGRESAFLSLPSHLSIPSSSNIGFRGHNFDPRASLIRCISEVTISSGLRAPFLHKVDGKPQFTRKRFTVADTLVSLVQLEYLARSKQSSFVMERKEHSCTSPSQHCFQTSMSGSTLASIVFSGHSVSSCTKNAGPVHHLSSSIRDTKSSHQQVS